MIDRAILAVNRALLAVASLGVLLLAILVLTGVISRYVFGSPFRIVMPFTEYLLLGVVFFALAAALQSGTHVRIDVVTEMLPKRVALIARQMGDALGVVVSGLLTWFSVEHYVRVLETGETDISILRIPLWTIQWVMVMGFGFLTITYALHWVRTWRDGIEPSVPGNAESATEAAQ